MIGICWFVSVEILNLKIIEYALIWSYFYPPALAGRAAFFEREENLIID